MSGIFNLPEMERGRDGVARLCGAVVEEGSAASTPQREGKNI